MGDSAYPESISVKIEPDILANVTEDVKTDCLEPENLVNKIEENEEELSLKNETSTSCDFNCNEGKGVHIQSDSPGTRLSHRGTQKPFKCTHCSASFVYKKNLKQHESIHTGERPFKCSLCSAAFNYVSKLEVHSRSHTGEKPYKCSRCKAAFASSHYLKRHLKTHTEEKPFKCTQCQAAFPQLSYLRQHEYSHRWKTLQVQSM